MNTQVTSLVSGEDRISALPDDIICSILSNLYVEESARTSILSKRWQKMWLLSPIIISDESIVKQSCMYCFTDPKVSSWIINVMSHIIFSHPGPIHTCHFTLPDWIKHCDTLANLLKTLTQKGIRNLKIDSFVLFNIPYFVLECDSLVNVHLENCSIPAQLSTHMNIFPNLRKLTLKYCDMNNGLFVNLLSSRSIIELALSSCDGLKDVVIVSDSLQQLYIGTTNVDNVTIKDVPNLESFNFDGSCSKVAILSAPKLKVLSCIDMERSKLQLGSYLFEFDYEYKKISGEITYMPSLRSLYVELGFNYANAALLVPHVLMCFPRLETLEVRMNYGFDTSSDEDVYNDYKVSRKEAGANINCLNHHLKSVRLYNNHGIQEQLDFARLIIANAKVLETLTIVYGEDIEERWMESLKHFLMQNRASNMLRVEFLKGG